MITKEDIIHWFEVLKNKCDRVTTGNCSHEINSIRFLASNWASKIKKEQGETIYPEKVEIFGEGYGLKIQKGGNYIKDHCDFILFDVRILTSTGESLWLTREACEDIAKKLNLKIVPLVGYMTIKEAEDFVKAGFKSLIAENKDYIAEGLVLKAPCGLLNRRGKRIITKIKYCDYKDL